MYGVAADALASMEQRIAELTENGQRLVEAADGWKAQAQHFQRERNALEAQLAEEKSIALDAEFEARIATERADKEIDMANEAMAENAALREDAERYRWFRLQGLWDSEHFPWPDGFEYPAGISEHEGKMLDAAIDAARKA
jgi:septal ring factor EnvC (AmiA/AmiB activator)